MKALARIRATLLMAATAVLIGAVTAGPVSAHTSLKDASPMIGSTVGPPTQVVLTYNNPVRFTQVLVTDATGRQYQSGKPVNVDNTVTQQVAPAPPNGRYTVAWRVVAPDGHPIEGTYQFTVAGSNATTPAAAPQAPAGQATGSSSSGTGLLWLGLIGGLLIAAAAVGGVMLRKPNAETDDHTDADVGADR